MSFVTERLDLSPVQIPTVCSFSFDLLRNPEQRKLEIFCTTLLLNLCKFPKFTHDLFSDRHLIFSHLIWHMNFKAEFIQICFQCSADFIQPSFHLFCDVAISWSVSINRALLSLFFDRVHCGFTLIYILDAHACTILRPRAENPSLSAVLFSSCSRSLYRWTVTSSSLASQASCRVSFPLECSYAVTWSRSNSLR